MLMELRRCLRMISVVRERASPPRSGSIPRWLIVTWQVRLGRSRHSDLWTYVISTPDISRLGGWVLSEMLSQARYSK